MSAKECPNCPGRDDHDAEHCPLKPQSADGLELLPCPFCGGPVELEQPISEGYRKFYGVVCRNTKNRGGTCAIEQRPSASREAAIARWNARAQDTDAQRLLAQFREELAQRDAEVERLSALINTPHTDEWFEAVRLEAAHQIERWGTSHDAGKTPADWFWLLGYLGQKAMTAQIAGDDGKARHHTISSGAMLLNWFRAMVGDSTAMRPGIEVKS